MKSFLKKIFNRSEYGNLQANKKMIPFRSFLAVIIVAVLLCGGCATDDNKENNQNGNSNGSIVATDNKTHGNSNGGNKENGDLVQDAEPTEEPTEAPTEKPTEKPIEKPAVTPAETPAEKPTATPSVESDFNRYFNSEYLSDSKIDLSKIPEYSDLPYAVVNDNKPFFKENEITNKAYEKYSSLDGFGRCGVTIACCGTEIMPADGEERGSISSIKPTGWIQAQYDCVSGKYLYNRCHLIGWQLSAENANDKNLITGTKYINVQGMLPFENMVADYINETENHVMYRITPIFEGNNLLASGVQMEAYSVEDVGEGICFNIYCYNVQPGVEIDYATGNSWEVSQDKGDSAVEQEDEKIIGSYILNTNTKKIHNIGCYSIDKMSEKNKKAYTGDIQDVIDQGYTKCGNCW